MSGGFTPAPPLDGYGTVAIGDTYEMAGSGRRIKVLGYAGVDGKPERAGLWYTDYAPGSAENIGHLAQIGSLRRVRDDAVPPPASAGEKPN